MSRVVVWFSCGAASAVAAKIALEEHSRDEVVLAYCDPGSEHPDNARFLVDVEKWLGVSVTKLKSEKYKDTWEVFRRERYLSGIRGAKCTTELKKVPRFGFQRADDIQVYGFTVEERARADRFRKNNFEVTLETPLIDHWLRKADCLAIIQRAGIELPAMYRLGYRNNNCIGCVKGGMGYWNKIRVDFPEVFARMAAQERELGASILRKDGERVFLDELDPTAGKYEAEDAEECSLLCVDVAERAVVTAQRSEVPRCP